MFKEQYYVQVIGDGKEVNEKNNRYYEYKLSGFDKDGTEKTMEFTAYKNLRKEAFLRVYYADKKGVTSWEEIQPKDIPEKAKEKLNVT